MTVSTTGNRAEYSLNATTASFAFASGGVNFTVFDDDDLKVYVNGVLKTKTTHYTVSINTSNEGTVTFVSSPTDHRPVSGDKVIIVREVPLTQNTNYQNNNIFDAETLETSIDLETMKSQQISSKTDRAIKFADDVLGVDSNVTEISTGGTERANKIIGFDSNGDITATQELGANRGNWATSTAYVLRDIVKQNVSAQTATYSNIYICISAHTSTGSYLTQNDSAKWQLVFDIATTTANALTATTKALHASRSEDNAEAYANTAENTAVSVFGANNSADPTVGTTTTDGFSSLHHREKSKEFAQTVDAQVTDDSGTANQGYSSKEWAVGKVAGNTDGSSKQWALGGGASFASGTAVSGSNFSAKEYAQGDIETHGGSAKAWAIDSSSPDGSSEHSAKSWASKSTGTVDGSTRSAKVSASDAKKLAMHAVDSQFTLDDGTQDYSAKHYWTKSNALFEALDDKYLGSFSSAPSADNDGDALTSGDIYLNTTDNKLYYYSGSAWTSFRNETNTVQSSTGNDHNLSTLDNNQNINLTPHGTGEVNISKVDIDSGTIDGTDITVGSGKTLDVSAGTFTTSTAQAEALGAFASGTKMLFHQSSAPSGWTKVTTTGSGNTGINDVGLRVVTGNITDGVAGSVAFDTAFASQTIPTHTLTTGQLASHNHSHGATPNWGSGPFCVQYAYGGQNTSITVNPSGGNGAHGHGSIDLNVKYIDLIVASKD